MSASRGETPYEDLLVRARWLVLDGQRALRDGALLVRAGQVLDVLDAEQARRHQAASTFDCGAAALTPGLVDAHTHLELDELGGVVTRGADFPSWIRAVVAARAGIDPLQGVRRGLAQLASTGTVAVGDIANRWCDGDAARELAASGAWPIVVVHREVLDAGDVARASVALEQARLILDRELAPWCVGLSPHAPYTVLDSTLEKCGALALRQRVPLQIHWSETAEEEDWLAGRTGPFDALLGPPAGRGDSLARFERAGLLRSGTVLVHGNHAAPRAADRLAARGVALVHCPGTHAFFERAPFPLEAWRAAGVDVCLGTDSRASNTSLDMRVELQRAALASPGIDARTLWSMATTAGARALGLADRVGSLAPGRPFTAAAFESQATCEADLFDELVRARPPVVATWVAGRAIYRAHGH